MSEVITTVLTEGSPKPIKFVVGTLVGASTNAVFESIEVELLISETGNPDEISINRNPYIISSDNLVDAAALTAITGGILAVAGVTALSLTGLAIAGGLAYVYSKFIDPLTDELILELAGQDQTVIVDSAGNVLGGMVFPDGIPSLGIDAIHSTIVQASVQGLSVVGKKIQLHTDIWPSLEYRVFAPIPKHTFT